MSKNMSLICEEDLMTRVCCGELVTDGNGSKTKEKRTKKDNGKYNDAYANYTGYSRACPSLGAMYEREEQLCNGIELPKIGDIIELYNVGYFNRALPVKGEVQVKRRKFYSPASDCVTVKGDIMKFKVVGYTHGRENGFMAGNKMVLECVYPEYSARLALKKTFPTRFIASGVTTAVYVEDINVDTEFCSVIIPV